MSDQTRLSRRTVLRLAAAAAALAATNPVLGASAVSRNELVTLPIAFDNTTFPEVINGVYQGPNLIEASGIVASRRYPGVLWIIRDGYQFNQPEPVRSRYRNALYAVRFDVVGRGELLQWPDSVPQVFGGGYLRYVPMHAQDGSVPRMVSEDIALVPGRGAQPDAIWCGNIGNNTYGSFKGSLWRCDEPDPYADADVVLDEPLTYWTNPDHGGPQANCESLLAVDGALYLIVKGVPDGSSLQVGEVLRLPQQVGVAVDAEPVAVLPQPAGVNWHPSAADLDGESLLVATGSAWYRYEGNPKLTGDALMRDLAVRAPVASGKMNADGSQASTEGIAWLRTGPPGGFMVAAEKGVLRWWPGERTVPTSQS